MRSDTDDHRPVDTCEVGRPPRVRARSPRATRAVPPVRPTSRHRPASGPWRTPSNGVDHDGDVSWLGFVDSLVRSLAWPAVVLIAALLFRTEFAGLVARLTHLKVPGGEATFGEGLAKAERTFEKFQASVTGVEAASGQPGVEEPDGAGNADSGPVEPSALVLRSWEQLAEEIIGLAHASVPGVHTTNAASAAAALERAGIVNDLFVETANELRELRNAVAHAKETPTPGSAIAYADQARELQVACRALAQLHNGLSEAAW